MKLCLYSVANVDKTGYGAMLKNFTIALFQRGIDLVDFYACDRADVQIFIGQPARILRNFKTRRGIFDYLKRKSDRFFLFSMFEAEKLPPNWAQDINQWFDAVIVPSDWCKEKFVNAGVTLSIHKVPLGINPNDFPFIKRPDRDTFTIVWQGLYFGDRKGNSLVRRALEELDLPKVRLIEKIVPFALKARSEFAFYSEKIWSICEVLPQTDMLFLLKEADLSLNPTSGEGFGLIPLEHMATGLPAIVSDNSGCKEYINADYNIPIQCRLMEAFFGGEYGLDERPDYEDMKAKLVYCYNHREEIKEMGWNASRWVRDEWTWDRATDKLLEVIKNV
jgi:glycosyltransferase involved in cell wall biosynthesis